MVLQTAQADSPSKTAGFRSFPKESFAAIFTPRAVGQSEYFEDLPDGHFVPIQRIHPADRQCRNL
jgi:hypothetical protein